MPVTLTVRWHLTAHAEKSERTFPLEEDKIQQIAWPAVVYVQIRDWIALCDHARTLSFAGALDTTCAYC
jgi:hypothetical protein